MSHLPSVASAPAPLPRSHPVGRSTVIREAGTADAAAWTAFVERHPDANLYHTVLWRDFIAEVFGLQPLYLLAEHAGDICGLLPMFLVERPWLGSKFGAKLISLPFDIGSGGPLATDDTVARELAEAAIAIARARRVDYLELRCNADRPLLAALPLEPSESVLISDMPLVNEAAVWANVQEDHRKAIRKAERRGITVREATSRADYATFNGIYLRVFRDFGTPPYGDRYFPTLWQNVHPAGGVRLLLAFVDTRCVGGLLLFCWQENLISKFAACLPEAVPLRAYAALYWRAIELGLASGYRRLSWGTSSRDQTGLIEFKERWGARTRPAVVYALPVRGRPPPMERFYDTSHWTRRLWRRLPIPLTRAGGALLNRWYC